MLQQRNLKHADTHRNTVLADIEEFRTDVERQKPICFIDSIENWQASAEDLRSQSALARIRTLQHCSFNFSKNLARF